MKHNKRICGSDKKTSIALAHINVDEYGVFLAIGHTPQKRHVSTRFTKL